MLLDGGVSLHLVFAIVSRVGIPLAILLLTSNQRKAPTMKRTYGDHIKKLVKDMRKHGRLGVFMLEQALKDLCECDDLTYLGEKLLQDTPGYKKLGVCFDKD